MYFYIFPNREYAVGACTGTLASTFAVLILHPVEAIKVRMQTAQHVGAEGGLLARSALLLRRPYAGVGPHLLQYSLLNSVRFGSYAAAQGFFQRRNASSPEALGKTDLGKRQLMLSETFACGAFSGVCIAATLHPLFAIKTHQQANRLGVAEAATRLWHGEGVRGFFRAFAAGFVRFPIALGVFFTSYEALKRLSASSQPAAGGSSDPVRPVVNFRISASGALAGIACWTSIYPLDVVQSRVIGEAVYGPQRKYPTVSGTFATLLREEGAVSFVRGYSAVLVRSGPVNALLLPANEALAPMFERVLPAS